MKWIEAIVVAAALGSGGLQSKAPGCTSPERQAMAVQLARAINTAEAASFRGQRSYLQLGDLPVGKPPSGMTVQLSTDGESYAFSIKDGEDACHGALFSDQAGVVYAGTPIQ